MGKYTEYRRRTAVGALAKRRPVLTLLLAGRELALFWVIVGLAAVGLMTQVDWVSFLGHMAVWVMGLLTLLGLGFVVRWFFT